MRVTGNTYPDTLTGQLNSLVGRQNRIQTQIATGQRLATADEDPEGARRILRLRTEASSLSQYRSNISTLKDQATTMNGSIQSLQKILDRASEISISADGTRSKPELTAYATELNQLISQAAQSANAKFGNDFLFGGTATDAAPFSVTADASGNITAVTYNGNTTNTQAQIGPNENITIGIPGQNTTGSGTRGLFTDSRFGADIFKHLIDLKNNLQTGNTTAISQTNNAQVNADLDNVLYHVASNGATLSRLESATSSLTDRTHTLQSSLSQESDVDLTQAIVDLNTTQNAYKAALQSGADLLQKSLLDYLR
jgi:flagellar hook-associated protein 3 FlgL